MALHVAAFFQVLSFGNGAIASHAVRDYVTAVADYVNVYKHRRRVTRYTIRFITKIYYIYFIILIQRNFLIVARITAFAHN